MRRIIMITVAALVVVLSQAVPASAVPPVADSGPSSVVKVGVAAQLHGTASDPDGDPVQIRWLRSAFNGGSVASCTFSGPTGFEPISASGLNPTVSCTQPGDYLLQLVAADGTSSFDSIGATVTVTPNHRPVVNSGPSVTVPVATDAQLAGSVTDPDGDALEIRWIRTVVSGGSLASCTFSGPTSFTPLTAAGLAPTLNCTQAGEYLLQLVAGDGELADDDIGTLVTFTPAPNHPPGANSGPSVSTTVGSVAQLQGSVSDPDGDALEIRWIRSVVSGASLATCTFTGPTGFVPVTPAGLAPTMTCSQPGQYLLQLVVGDGQLSDDDTGALVTFTAAPSSDRSPAVCSAVHLRSGWVLRISDPQSGVKAYRSTPFVNATVSPAAVNLATPVPTLDATLSRQVPWFPGGAFVRHGNGAGLESTCFVVSNPDNSLTVVPLP
jgi:hypothetical protein